MQALSFRTRQRPPATFSSTPASPLTTTFSIYQASPQSVTLFIPGTATTTFNIYRRTATINKCSCPNFQQQSNTQLVLQQIHIRTYRQFPRFQWTLPHSSTSTRTTTRDGEAQGQGDSRGGRSSLSSSSQLTQVLCPSPCRPPTSC